MLRKDQCLSVSEATDIAEVHRGTVIQWCKKYGLGVKIGGRWRVKKDEFFLFLMGGQERSGRNELH